MSAREIAIPRPDDVALAGTLAAPPGAQAGVLILNGSGPLDRDANMPGQAHDLGRALAEGLSARGVASLRFDKRGVGASGGTYLTTGFHEEAADAQAALGALGEALGPQARLFVAGHSVGATIALRLAARADLAGLVLLSVAAQPGEAVMRWQSQRFADTARGLERWLSPLLLRRQSAQRRRLGASTRDVVRLGGVDSPARWFREFMAHDPAADLAAVRCPVLAITGADDVQVDPADVARIAAAVPGPFTGEVPEGISHLLRKSCGAPGLASYARELRGPPEPVLVARVCDWIAGSGSDPLPAALGPSAP